MAKFTVEFTRILFFEDTFEADDEGTARELATEQADNYMIQSPSDGWDSANDSLRVWTS
jgi:hypothetical protein